MTKEIILITDTIDGKIPDNLSDLFGASTILKNNDSEIRLFISSVEKLEIKAPESLSIKAVNLINEEFICPMPENYAKILIKELKDKNPSYILLPHTMRGCMMASYIASKLEGSLVTGVNGITFENNKLNIRREVMAGKWVSESNPDKQLLILTLSTGALSDSVDTYVPVDTETKRASFKDHKVKTLKIENTIKDDDNSVEDADFVVGAGMGAADEEILDIIKTFASKLKNSAVGSSRPLCDSGLMPYSRQVGETGKQISPKIYIACCISGSNQHIAGIKKSGKIIAINKDPQAPIFRAADLGIVERIEDILPKVMEEIERG